MKTEELEQLKCLWKSNLEKQVQLGFIEVNPHSDVDCLHCTSFYSAILCYHYINLQHLNQFKRLYI